jgi:hypothetical protein
MKRDKTYFNHETTTSDNHSAILKADALDSKEILALKAELTELKESQTTVTTTKGQVVASRLIPRFILRSLSYDHTVMVIQ